MKQLIYDYHHALILVLPHIITTNIESFFGWHHWRDETARSSISHGLVSKIIPNLPIWGIKRELRGIMVNTGRIHREFRYFRDIFWNLVKLDDELRWEIRENGVFGKKTQRSIRGIKNHSIWISNHGEIKDGSREKFRNSRRTYLKLKWN